MAAHAGLHLVELRRKPGLRSSLGVDAMTVGAADVATVVDGPGPVLRERARMTREAGRRLLARGFLLRPRRRGGRLRARAVRGDGAVAGLTDLRHRERRSAETRGHGHAAMHGLREGRDLADMAGAAAFLSVSGTLGRGRPRRGASARGVRGG